MMILPPPPLKSPQCIIIRHCFSSLVNPSIISAVIFAHHIISRYFVHSATHLRYHRSSQVGRSSSSPLSFIIIIIIQHHYHQSSSSSPVESSRAGCFISYCGKSRWFHIKLPHQEKRRPRSSPTGEGRTESSYTVTSSNKGDDHRRQLWRAVFFSSRQRYHHEEEGRILTFLFRLPSGNIIINEGKSFIFHLFFIPLSHIHLSFPFFSSHHSSIT